MVGILLIVKVISSTALALHGKFLVATKVKVTDPLLLSLGPGVYVGEIVDPPVNVPSPFVLH